MELIAQMYVKPTLPSISWLSQKTLFLVILLVTSAALVPLGLNQNQIAKAEKQEMATSTIATTSATALTNENNANSLNVQDIPMKKVHVGDIDIAYKVFGKGDPILLLTGSGSVMDNWSPTILRDLSSSHTVIIFDHRGVGNTTTGTKPFSMVQFANDTAGLLDALKIQKADVLGYSMGSFVAQELVLLHPDKVNRLILVASTCGGKEGIPESPEVAKLATDFAYNRTHDVGKMLSLVFPPSWLQSHANSLALPPSKEIVPLDTAKQQDVVVKAWFAHNWSGVCDQLSKVTVPTLVVQGTEDLLVPPGNALIIAQKIPGAWLVHIEGAGHGLMYQYPEKVSAVLQTFLTTTTATMPSS